MAYLIAAFYKFTPLADAQGVRRQLARRACHLRLTGTLLVASEGINGALAGDPDALRTFLEEIRGRNEIGPFAHKESWSDARPFRRLKVRLKTEIVSMGAPGIVSAETVGVYVGAARWAELLDDPDVAVVDTRNAYEVAIGRFKGAIDPKTDSFRDFPAWAEAALAPGGALAGTKAVAMYCTGGIRCEKSTALMRQLGVARVYHLEGGLLKYFEAAGPQDDRFDGHCFVFDDRVSVGADLAPGPHEMCRGCRRPVAPEDLDSPLYRPGVCCPACADALSEERAGRFAERERQMRLAAARGVAHLKTDPS